MKKYVVTLLLVLVSVFVLNSMTAEAAAPDFKEISITKMDDMRDYDAKVSLSVKYEWGNDGLAANAEGKYTEAQYGKFTLTEDSIVRIKIIDTTEAATMKNWFRLYQNDSLTIPVLDTEMGGLEDHYVKLAAGTYYTECGYEFYEIYKRSTKIMIGAISESKAVEVNQSIDTKKKTITLTAVQKFAKPCDAKAFWQAGKVSSATWESEPVNVVDDTVVITLDKKAKGWYTIEFKSDTTGFADTDVYCQAYVYVEGIKTPGTKGKTYTKSNVKYKVTKNKDDGTGTVTVIGMKSHKTSVTIPKTVKINDYTYTINKIEKKAFYKKSKLKKVTIKATGITSFGKDAFKGINKKATVYVPKSKYKTYSSKLKKVGVKSPMKIKKK